MRHELKIWPPFFREVMTGRASCEIREEDRDYRELDQLDLYEWDPMTKAYTGEHVLVEISLVLCGDACHLMAGYVALMIRPTDKAPQAVMQPGAVRYEK